MKPAASILVIVTRRIGDVLLTTPLIRSVKRAWPGAAIDVLVFAGTEGVLAANPDIRRVLTVAERPSGWDHVKLMAAIARRYDVALSTVPSDRPTLYAWLAGRWRAGLVVDAPKHRWKKHLLHRSVVFDNRDTHTVLMHLALARVLDVPPCYDVVAAWRESDRGELARALPFALNAPYAVLHTYPKFNYKMWHRVGWVEVARWLQARELRVVLSGGNEPAELAYVAAIAREIPGAINLAGKLPLSEAACLIAGARAYVGPDTAVTHMAAALGVPVVALYGATDPVKWGPWPTGYARAVNPWRRLGTQRVNNVILVQGDAACAPCFNEGCGRSIDSFSDCLQHLPAAAIIGALAALLDDPGARPATRV
jgi:heptosyltransferase-3